MRCIAGALTSRIGRRFVLLFAGCALLPLVVFAALAVHRVSVQADADLAARLHNDSKSAGMGLAARLSQVAGDLALVVDLVNGGVGRLFSESGSALQRQVEERVDSIQLLTAAGRRVLHGGAEPIPCELSAGDREHLAAGRPIVRYVGEPGALVMLRRADEADGVVVVRIRPDWFWDPEELRGSRCEFAACTRGGRVLYGTTDFAAAIPPLLAAVRRTSASGSFAWFRDGEEQVARYWRVFLQPQYRLDLLVVQSQSRHEAVAVADAFVARFWAIALVTLLLVLLASLVQLRRTLDPIVRLRAAAARLGGGDLTARVRLDRPDEFGELGRAFDDMAARLQENSAQRARSERELVASRDAALAAARAKATFVTNVSHELRTPMAEILGAAEILTMLDAGDDEARVEFANIALQGSRRLARLVDDVLALGEDEDEAPRAVDVAAALRAAVAGLPAEVRSRVTSAIEDGLPAVLGSARRLTETFGQLLDNAVKFGPADQPIEARARRQGQQVVVEIVDHGSGIAPEDHERIFEPFAQVGRDQLTDKAGGTGLGLTLARRAVTGCGGTIEVESAPGAGATFRVRLPLAAEVAAGCDPAVDP